MSRRFAAANDEVRYPVQSISNFTGACSFAILLKFNSANNVWQALLAHNDSTGAYAIGFERAGPGGTTDALALEIAGAGTHYGTVTARGTDGWVVLGMSRPAVGSNAWRSHVYKAGSWTHEAVAMDNGNAAPSQSGGSIRIGEFEDVDDADAWIAADAGWAADIGDAGFNALTVDLNTWVGHATPPAYAHQHNQATSSEDILDLMGNGHVATGTISGTTDAVGIAGTAMDPANDPPGVVYIGASTPATPVALDPQIQWTDDFGPGDFGPNPFAEEFVVPSAVGPVFAALTAADTLGTTDSASRAALLLARTVADTLGTSDVATRLVALPRTAGDTLGTTDAATRAALLRVRTASDSLATTDAAARAALSFTRTAADSLGTTDAATGAKFNARTATDTLGTTDAAARAALLLARTASDTLNTTDMAARAALSRARTAADTLGTSDTAARVLFAPRTAADSLSTTDTAARGALLRTRIAADTLGTTDTAAPGTSRTAGDALGTTDSAARVVVRFRTAADSLGTSDTASKTVVRVRAAADTLNTTDTAARRVLLARGAADTLGTIDSANTTGPAAATFTYTLDDTDPFTYGQAGGFSYGEAGDFTYTLDGSTP